MSEGPALALRDIRKSYGKTEALRGLSFDVRDSEFVGLLGPNGAGKSTLFQIAAGLFEPDGGEAQLFGLSYRKHASEILARLGVVFQSRSLDLDMTVAANLRFHGHLFGLSGRLLKSRIAEAAELLEITDLVSKPVRTLSGGNQRRVEIARALLNEPKLLLMDEPSVGLDATTRRLLVQHIEQVRALKGTSILWATHLVDEVESADRVVLIDKGETRLVGTPAEILTQTATSSLADAYVALMGAQEPAAGING